MKKITIKSWSDNIKDTKKQICLPLTSLEEPFATVVGEVRIDKNWKGLKELDSFVIAPAYIIKKQKTIKNSITIIEEIEIIEMNIIRDENFILFSDKDRKEAKNGE